MTFLDAVSIGWWRQVRVAGWWQAASLYWQKPKWHVSLWALATDCPNAILVKSHIQTRELCLDICCWTLLHFRFSSIDSLHGFRLNTWPPPTPPTPSFAGDHQPPLRDKRLINCFTNLSFVSSFNLKLQTPFFACVLPAKNCFQEEDEAIHKCEESDN